jgi:hypothetical protein
MSPAWKSGVGSLILGSVIGFALGGLCVYEATSYAALAQRESTTTASVTQMQQAGSHRSSADYTCYYSHTVNEIEYSWQTSCLPKLSGNSIKETLEVAAGLSQTYTATVYYDQADPSTGSPTEFGAQRERSYLFAKVPFGVGVMLIVLAVLGAVVASSSSKGGGGIIVDAEGTVIYPDQMDSGGRESADNPIRTGSEEEPIDRSMND